MSSDECVLKERYKGTTQQESQAKGARKSGTFGRLRSSTHRASRLGTQKCWRSRSGRTLMQTMMVGLYMQTGMKHSKKEMRTRKEGGKIKTNNFWVFTTCKAPCIHEVGNILFPFYRWGNWDSEKKSNFLKASHLISNQWNQYVNPVVWCYSSSIQYIAC